MCPFVIVRDSNEGAPFPFRDLRTSKSNGSLPIVIKTVEKAMWSMGLADYSIEGFEEHIQVERKSLVDLFGSIAGRRVNFEAEIARLNERCDFACVVIEAGWVDILKGVENSKVEPASVIGTILAWQQRYPKVHWMPMGTRAMAEKWTYRVLERWWKDWEEKQKK